MNRKEQAIETYQRHASLLACPLCRAAMAVGQGGLRCERGHSFDFARQGYVNLFTGRHVDDYDADLFRARSALCAAGFFNPMLDALMNTLGAFLPQPPAVLAVLDAGCGEGSHLAALADRLRARCTDVIASGVDLAKPAIQQAARHEGILWAVADLARLPFSGRSFDVIINILSPARYDEFARVLKPGGLLVKAVPGAYHLRELRDALGLPEDYENTDVAARFAGRFRELERREVRSAMTFAGQGLRDLVRMTPLAWNAPRERIEALPTEGLTVTAHFLLLAGRAGD